MTTLNVRDGYIALPRRISLALGVAFLSQSAYLIWHMSKFDSHIEQLDATDRRLIDRDQALSVRIDALDRDRDRLARVEEQIRIATDLLREIRQEMRRPH